MSIIDDKEIISFVKSNVWKILLVFSVILIIILITNILTQNNDQKIVLGMELLEELKVEQMQYSDGMKQYIHESDKLKDAVNSIESTDNCMRLVHLFELNTSWTARPMLADKILTTCQ